MAGSEYRVTLDRGDGSTVEVHHHGGTVISWKCQGQEMLFCSKKAVFDNKKAIRGGVPVVFPQFGPWKLGPQHGFARIKQWKVEKQPTKLENGDVIAILCLEDDEETRAMWNYGFKLVYEICLQQDALKFTLTVQNKGDESFEFTTLLHTYFSTPDVTKTEVHGLKGLKYVDKVKDGSEFTEEREAVTIKENYDRVYQNAPSKLTVTQTGDGKSKITIDTTNLPDIVVWNPWSEKAKAMSDFGDEEYEGMICVEAGSVTNPVSLAGNSSLLFSQTLTMSRL